jgi:hypothetical protein
MGPGREPPQEIVDLFHRFILSHPVSVDPQLYHLRPNFIPRFENTPGVDTIGAVHTGKIPTGKVRFIPHRAGTGLASRSWHNLNLQVPLLNLDYSIG